MDKVAKLKEEKEQFKNEKIKLKDEKEKFKGEAAKLEEEKEQFKNDNVAKLEEKDKRTIWRSLLSRSCCWDQSAHQG